MRKGPAASVLFCIAMFSVLASRNKKEWEIPISRSQYQDKGACTMVQRGYPPPLSYIGRDGNACRPQHAPREYPLSLLGSIHWLLCRYATAKRSAEGFTQDGTCFGLIAFLLCSFLFFLLDYIPWREELDYMGKEIKKGC